ncbi:MAG: hypothetical protein K9K82_11715 [Desulfobacteraceae bacterium]|nr:hypothetical protein [Desulfobacteraceae bacterium]
MTRSEYREWAKELLTNAADLLTDDQITRLIDSAVDIMTDKQVGEWSGVRAWQELDDIIAGWSDEQIERYRDLYKNTENWDRRIE